MAMWDGAPNASKRKNQLGKYAWRVGYRLQRIVMRDLRKALIDMFLYGVGYIKIPGGDAVERVAPEDVVVEMTREGQPSSNGGPQ